MKSLLCQAALTIASVSVPLQAQEPPALKVVQDLRIDAVEHDLSPIGFVAVSPNGTIAMAQNQDGLIRFFDARGAFLGTFGRKGRGPGEFQTVGRFSWIADTLVVNDVSLRRFTLISPEQKLVRVQLWLTTVITNRSEPAAPRFSFPLPWTIYPNGDLLVAAPLAKGSPLPDWPGATNAALPLIRADSTGAYKQLIAWQAEENCDVPIQDGRGTAGIPFCSTNRLDISPDGTRLAFARAERSTRTFHLVVVRATGDTVFLRNYPYRPIPLTKSDRDQAIASMPKFPGMEEALEKASFPEHRAPVGRILLGRDGSTWLELATVTGARTWNVLDAKGDAVGRVRLKRNVTAIAVSREQLWATETDGDGLQHIVRYRITP